MKLKSKRWTLSVVSAMLVFTLAACGSSGSKGSSKEDSSSPAPTMSQDPVTLTFYQTSSGWDDKRFMDNYGNKIKEKFPWITINFIPSTGLATVLASGQEIDILFASIGATKGNLLAYDLQSDISDLIKKYKVDLNRFDPTTIEMQKQVANGAMYGLPTDNRGGALWYSKDIFDKFGVPYPKDDLTWDQTYEIAKALTRNEGGVQYRGMSTTYMISPTNQLSLSLVDKNTNTVAFDKDPKFAQLVENFARFYKIPGNEITKSQTSFTAQKNFFVKDKTAAMYTFLTGVQDFPPDLNWDVAALPTFKDRPGVGLQAYPTYFYLTSMSKKRDAAFNVISYLSSDEFQMWQSKNGGQTVLKSKAIEAAYGQDVPAFIGKHVQAFFVNKYADPAYQSPYDSLASGQLGTAYNEVTLGIKDVNTALRDATDLANKAIADATKK